MAEDKGKKKGTKGKSKKDKPEPRNWAKIALQLFIVFIMVMSVLAFTLNNRGSNTGSNTDTSSTDKSFNGIEDGLKLIPANASYARYVDLKNDSVLADSVQIQKYYWLFGTLPSEKVFNAKPQRDLFAIYPQGYFGDFTEQFVSLTDFGTAKINQSYPDYYNIQGVIAKRVNNKYFYTGTTKPVVSGRIENVAPTIEVMLGGNASAYGNYSDLFDELKWKQIITDNMTLEIVGKSSNTSYIANLSCDSDRFYVSLQPMDRANKSDNKSYCYVAIMHMNQTPTDQDYNHLAIFSDSMKKMGFSSYEPQIYDDYIVIEAQGSLNTCIDNMYILDFIQYKASI
jgi:hypothetical protein